MTSPPTGGTIGGGGFQSGDDFIAARVTIDIPTEGISGLREITQEMDRFRTSVESANRSSETFSSYLMRIAEAANQAATAQENLVQMLERTNDYQDRSVTSGGPQPQLNASPQYTNPFAASGIGLGGGGGGAGIDDVNTQLAALQSQNPRAYINKMAASGQYRMGDIAASSPTGMDIQGAADRIGQRAQLVGEGQVGIDGVSDIGSRSGRMGAIAQQVLNEINPGANPMGVPGMIQRGLGAMGSVGNSMGGSLGTGLGRMAGLAGPIAGAAGIGLAGYGLVQGAGGIYQDYKNMGSVRGGGAAEGVGYEMSIRAMAMNPFISSDQSRQIIQQGLRDGYTGKEFDTITSMVATNLKDFNMQIGDSFNLVRKNVVEGGQSMLGLAGAMSSLKEMSKDGYRSLPELQQSYAATSGTLIGAGMSGTEASQAALISGSMFKDNAVLAGSGDGIAQSFASSPQNMAIMKYHGGLNAPAGLMPQAMPYMMQGDAMMAASQETIKKFAMQAWASKGKPSKKSQNQKEVVNYYNAVAIWGERMRLMGMPFAAPGNEQKVEEMFYTFVSGGNPVGEAAQEARETQKKQAEVTTRSPAQSFLGGQVDNFTAQASTGADFVGQALGSIGDLFNDNADNIGQRWSGLGDRILDRGDRAGAATSRYQIEALKNVQKQYGSRGFEIIDASQQVQKLDQNNKEQMERLSSGDLKWRPKGAGGAGYALSETPAGQDLKAFAGGKTEVSGAVTIGLTPEAQKLLQVQGGSKVQLTPHEQRAQSGYGDSTMNNAPPGEGRR